MKIIHRLYGKGYEEHLPFSRISFFGLMMSLSMIFSVPYFVRRSFASPVPSCPNPPKNNNIDLNTRTSH